MEGECFPHATGSGASDAAPLEANRARLSLELAPAWAVAGDDVENCHSELDRADAPAAVGAVDGARDLVPGLIYDLMPAAPIFVRGLGGVLSPLPRPDGSVLSSEQGLQQGIPYAGGVCSLMLLPHTHAADSILSPYGGGTRGYQDDHNHVGPVSIDDAGNDITGSDLIAALNVFERGINSCGLTVNPSKRQFFSPDPCTRDRIRALGMPLGMIDAGGCKIRPRRCSLRLSA